jgi:hypothetical protein
VILNDGNLVYNPSLDGKVLARASKQVFYRNPYRPCRALISYVNRMLQVKVDVSRSGQWEVVAELPHVDLPPGYFFGLTAATGGLSDNHDIFSFMCYSYPPYDQQQQHMENGQQPPQPADTNPPVPNTNTQKDDHPHDPVQEQLQLFLNQDKQHPHEPPQDQQPQQQQTEQPQQQAPTPTPAQPTPPTPPAAEQQQPGTPAPVQPQQQPQVQPVQQQQQQQQPLVATQQTDEIKQMLRVQQEVFAESFKVVLQKLQHIELQQDQMEQTVKNQAAKIEVLSNTQSMFASVLNKLLENRVTRDDIIGIDPSKNFQLLTKDTQTLKEIGYEMKSWVKNKLQAGTDEIYKGVNEISKSLSSLKYSVEGASQNQNNIASGLKETSQEIAKAIEKNTSFSFWTYFLFFQGLFAVFFLIWRKYRDDANKKFL